MSTDELRTQTCIIIRRNGEYLVGSILFSEELRWSRYRYDAWRTRDREMAADVARETGGIMVLFNPIVGDALVIGT